MSETHNLDDGVNEYFEFIVRKHKYRFRHLNTEEMDAVQKLDLGEDDIKAREYLYQFISKVEDSSPKFAEVAKELTAPHWKKFRQMLEAEMGGKD